VYNNPPPYDSNASYDYEPSSYSITPSLDPEALHLKLDGAASLDDGGSDQNAQPAQPEAAPNSPQSAPAQTQLVSSQPQT
jgi:hypothetical protein